MNECSSCTQTVRPVRSACDVYFYSELDLKALHIATDKLYDKVYVNE